MRAVCESSLAALPLRLSGVRRRPAAPQEELVSAATFDLEVVGLISISSECVDWITLEAEGALRRLCDILVDLLGESTFCDASLTTTLLKTELSFYNDEF